jgi:hypothetical protein
MARGRARIEDHGAEWLSLVETSGPFLAVPALKRALPDGLDATPPALPDLRVAFAEWRQDHRLQQRWVRWVLDEILELRDAVHEATDADPSHLVAEQAVTLRPSCVVRDHTRDGSPAVLIVHRVESGTALDRPIPGEAWAASPLDRAAELARASNVPLALVTDGSAHHRRAPVDAHVGARGPDSGTARPATPTTVTRAASASTRDEPGPGQVRQQAAKGRFGGRKPAPVGLSQPRGVSAGPTVATQVAVSS